MSKTTDWIYYFGYGSLVNRDTRPIDEFVLPARLNGWRRVWEHRTVDPRRKLQGTSLSIESKGIGSKDSAFAGGIDGVIAQMLRSDLAILDERETGYERLELAVSDFKIETDLNINSVFVYRSLQKNRLKADMRHPILQSYVDCVLEGYRSRFGESGLVNMIETTDGWEGPILNDRDEPHYPRSVSVDSKWQHFYDDLIRQKIADSK